MKSDSPFSNLPSLAELLKHPTVQGVVARVNQTTIAQRATGFLEEFQASWKGAGGAPSVGELAERLAQRLLGRSHHAKPSVNATGIICSRRWQAPLAEAAVHEILRFASDYQQPSAALHEQVVSSLVKLTSAEAAWVACSFEAAMSMANQCVEATVESSPLIGLLDPAQFGKEHVDTIPERLAGGADLVVLDGAGLLGGPRCGLVVGTKRFVQQLQASELALPLAADAMVLAALEATLELYHAPEKVMHQIPVLQLLSTPLENLRQRCERIAPLIAESERVTAAEATACHSVWLDTGTSQLSADSWAIMLRPAEGRTAEHLAQHFHQATPQVVGRVAEDALWIDFRAVFPRWDQQLVTAVQ